MTGRARGPGQAATGQRPRAAARLGRCRPGRGAPSCSRWCSPTRCHRTTRVYTLIFVAAASAWNLFSGFSGYISLGHAVFFGSGAYAVGIAARDWHVTGVGGVRAAAAGAAGRAR